MRNNYLIEMFQNLQTPREWIKVYSRYRKQSPFREYRGGLNFASFAYDATWVIAATLNNSIQSLAKLNESLENFHYGSHTFADIFKEEMAKIRFLGITVGLEINMF